MEKDKYKEDKDNYKKKNNYKNNYYHMNMPTTCFHILLSSCLSFQVIAFVYIVQVS